MTSFKNSDPSSSTSRLARFISESVLERLKNGSFVPQRKSKPASMHLSDRRKAFSPLAVTKRCIRYEPSVFDTREDEIIRVAEALNNPEKNVFLFGGDQGVGKTTLLRGVIELMGSGEEQLFWFDCNLHTDYEEIIQFLIEYITYVCSSFNLPEQSELPRDPFEKLTFLLNTVSHVPLFIVLDNVEYIVDSAYRFSSVPFKEVLNFLLGFDNIKLAMIGQRLPHAEMAGNRDKLMDLRLKGLGEEQAIAYIQKNTRDLVEHEDLQRLYKLCSGYPWLLKTVLYLHQKNGHSMHELIEELCRPDRLGSTPVEGMLSIITESLSPEIRKAMIVTGLLRHPISLKAITALSRYAYPDDEAIQSDGFEHDMDAVEQTVLRPVIKITYPPQEVLRHLRKNQLQAKENQTDETSSTTSSSFSPGYELYHQVKRTLYKELPDFERLRLHGALYDYYQREKDLALARRMMSLSVKGLLAEVRFHGERSRMRRDQSVIVDQRGLPDLENVDDLDDNDSDDNSNSTVIKKRDAEDDDGYSPKELLAQSGGDLTKIKSSELTSARLDDAPDGDDDDAIFFDGVTLTDEERTLLEKAVTKDVVVSEPDDPKNRRQDLKALAGDLLDESRLEKESVDTEERAITKQLAEAVANRDKPAMLTLLLALADYRVRHGKFYQAEECLNKALALEGRMGSYGDDSLMVDVYRLKGAIHQETFRHNSAEINLKKTLELIQKTDADRPENELVLGQVYRDLAEIGAYRHNYPQAVAYYKQAVEHYAKAASTQELGEVFFGLAGVYDDMERPEKAIKAYQHALKADTENGIEDACAATLANMAALYIKIERYEEAIDSYEEALKFDRKMKNKAGEIRTLTALARLKGLQDNVEGAEHDYRRALTLAASLSESWHAGVMVKLGNFYARHKRYDEADKLFRDALAVGRDDLSSKSIALIEKKIKEIDRVR